MKIVFGALIFALLLDALDAFIPKVSAFQTLGNGQMTQARNRRQMLNTINFFGAPKVRFIAQVALSIASNEEYDFKFELFLFK